MAATGLGDLADDDIDEIVARLPTRDAVRTSVLARSWRHRWKSIPDLDLTAVPLAAVNRTLRLHSAPLRRLKFRTSRRSAALARRFKFRALARRSSSSLRTIDISSWFSKFRLSTFARRCPGLTLIKLSGCVINNLRRPDRSIFHHLQTLDLDSIAFIHEAAADNGHLSIQTFIPACPRLERLSVQLHTLGRGRFREVRFDLNTIGRQFPRLAHLELDGLECCLNIVPAAPLASLRVLHLSDVCVGGKLPVLFSSCPSLETLILEDAYVDDEEHLRVDAPNLRQLELAHVRHVINGSGYDEDFRHVYDASLVFCLLSGAPNLQEVVFKWRYWAARAPEDRCDSWKEREHMGAFDDLKTASIQLVGGDEVVREFNLEVIQLLLSKAPVLETFHLRYDYKYTKSVMKTVLGLPRASPRAQLVF